MIKRIRAIIAVALLITLTTTYAEAINPKALGFSKKGLEKITRVYEDEVKEGHIPGAVILIKRYGKIVYAEAIGYQNKSKNISMKRNNIFRNYSMTKPFIAVATMQLMEQGKLTLADPVSKFIPELKDMKVAIEVKEGDKITYKLVPARREIQIIDLLRHTSGIVYGEITKNKLLQEAYKQQELVNEHLAYDVRSLTPEQEITAFSKVPLSTEPGTNWEYSLSVDLLGRIVEKVSGQRLSDYLKQNIFTPLNMVDTGFYITENNLSRLAEPLSIDPFTHQPIHLIDVSEQPANDSGGAGSVTTADDYLNFATMMLDLGSVNHQHILSPASIKLMTSDQLGNRTTLPYSPGQLLMGIDGYTFGLGFMVRKENGLAGVLGSKGEYMWAGAAGTFFWVEPEKDLAVVVMTQVPGPVRPYYRRLIKDLVDSALIN
ncbi:esterase EstB [Ferrovum sp. JA12]|uniref:serine hydrolase domain-containing protein n=1 Tax=Ferrovum sp. JA12 TaxID=1356299 RepID=UPI000702977D|nr:serine hydrolase domain-containing protein [Ferrovum sp. JA12]KRH79911.1 esterase EstB [Ferrovum sp. JA12]